MNPLAIFAAVAIAPDGLRHMLHEEPMPPEHINAQNRTQCS